MLSRPIIHAIANGKISLLFYGWRYNILLYLYTHTPTPHHIFNPFIHQWTLVSYVNNSAVSMGCRYLFVFPSDIPYEVLSELLLLHPTSSSMLYFHFICLKKLFYFPLIYSFIHWLFRKTLLNFHLVCMCFSNLLFPCWFSGWSIRCGE